MIFVAITSWVAKESKIIVTAKPKRTKLLTLSRKIHDYNIFLESFFQGKMKLEVIFM